MWFRRFVGKFVGRIFVVEKALDDDDLSEAADDEQDEVDARPENHPVPGGLGVVQVSPLNCRNLNPIKKRFLLLLQNGLALLSYIYFF